MKKPLALATGYTNMGAFLALDRENIEMLDLFT